MPLYRESRVAENVRELQAKVAVSEEYGHSGRALVEGGLCDVCLTELIVGRHVRHWFNGFPCFIARATAREHLVERHGLLLGSIRA